MFYETFEKLCRDKGTSPSAVCIELGFSRTTSSYWKRSNGIPKREALEKIADYLGVSVDYLLGRDSNNQTTADHSELQDAIGQLTATEKEDVLNYIKFVLSKRD